MEIDQGWQIFLCGCAGGVLVELLRWWKLRESLEFPAFVRKWTYWVLTGLMILAGGFIAWVHGMEKGTVMLAMNLGASAPATIAVLLTRPSAPGATPMSADERNFGGSPPTLGRLRRFLAFGR